MKARKRLLTIALTAALGLGVWTLAVSFNAANFGQGDILSAAELNDLLNDNFETAKAAIEAVETSVVDLEAATGVLEDSKLDKAGGAITGTTVIEGAAELSSATNKTAVFHVHKTGADAGAAAVFRSLNDHEDGTVHVEQRGSGPALSLKARGGGPLITGTGSNKVTFVLEQDGSIKIGDGPNPTLYLDAENGSIEMDGTITDSVGAGLPFAYGNVDAAGNKLSGTSNWVSTLTGAGTAYQIAFGEPYNTTNFVTVVTAGSADARSISTGIAGGGSSNAVLIISPRDAAGVRVTTAFSFIVYKPGG